MARKSFSAAEMLGQGRGRTAPSSDGTRASEQLDVETLGRPDASPPPPPPAGRYRRVTVYITEEQHRWARSVALDAQRDDVNLSVSDVVRLGLERLRRAGGDLRAELLAQAWAEAETHPGRKQRGLPPAPEHAIRTTRRGSD